MVTSQHPGGLEIILEFAGLDATSAFLDKGHSKDAIRFLEKHCIGELTLVYIWLSMENMSI